LKDSGESLADKLSPYKWNWNIPDLAIDFDKSGARVWAAGAAANGGRVETPRQAIFASTFGNCSATGHWNGDIHSVGNGHATASQWEI
jgi:hypothetical protein